MVFAYFLQAIPYLTKTWPQISRTLYTGDQFSFLFLIWRNKFGDYSTVYRRQVQNVDDDLRENPMSVCRIFHTCCTTNMRGIVKKAPQHTTVLEIAKKSCENGFKGSCSQNLWGQVLWVINSSFWSSDSYNMVFSRSEATETKAKLETNKNVLILVTLIPSSECQFSLTFQMLIFIR